MNNKNAAIRASSGFTLIEVMISIFVLGIGVIGVAGMQLNAYRSNQQSALATTATQLAQDIAERIRANDKATGPDDRSNPYLFDTNEETAEPAKGCFGNDDCSPLEIATSDIYQWKSQVAGGAPGTSGGFRGLPGGRGVVCRDDSPWENGKGYTWRCSTATQGANAPIVVKVGWLEKHADGSVATTDEGRYDDRPSVVILVKP